MSLPLVPLITLFGGGDGGNVPTENGWLVSSGGDAARKVVPDPAGNWLEVRPNTSLLVNCGTTLVCSYNNGWVVILLLMMMLLSMTRLLLPQIMPSSP